MNPLETALLTAVAFSTEPLVLCDPHQPDGPMIAVNPAFCAMSGYPEDEVVGRNCRFLQGRGTDPATPRRIKANLVAGQGCIEWIVNHRRDGRAFWNMLFITPILDEAGALRFFLGNQLDITQGFPDWLGEVTFGRAHMSPLVQAEFTAALNEILRTSSDPSRGLEQTIAQARRIAELATDLNAGPPPPGCPPLPARISAGAQA